MVVPTSLGRWLFTMGWTAGGSFVALARTAAGDPAAVGRMTPWWSGGLARAWGMEVVAHGRHHVEPGETYVMMANHRSHVDIVALFEALPVLPGFLAKKELRRIPLFGRTMEVGGHVFIDRTKRERAFEAIEEAAAQVRDGATIVVFPEGTRAERAGVKPFKKGGFHLARQAGVAILPIGIRGSADVLPKHGRRLSPGRVDVHIGAAIPAGVVTTLPLDELIALVHARICELSGLRPVEADPD
jgi:1-acyl-sn-glycerol-3-phosphate acyltransferase